jgi:hypothetical protein
MHFFNAYFAKMASGGKDPSDATLNKFYKCHPSMKVGAVVCVVCGEFYHTVEILAKIKSGIPVKILNNSFIICHEHTSFAITSKLPYGKLDETTGEFIAQLKLETREQIKKEILKELASDVKNKDELNETFCERYEVETLKMEDSLLKQLYKEVQEKNQIISELRVEEKQKNINNNNLIKTKTYSEALINIKPKSKKIPKLIIKKTNINDTNNL